MLLLEDPVARPIHTLAFAPDLPLLASVAGKSCEVHFWDLTTRTICFSLGGHTSRIVAVAFSPDGKRFASASFAGRLLVWRRSQDRWWQLERQLDWTREEGTHARGQLVFSPDSTMLATTMSTGSSPNYRYRRGHPSYSRIHLVRMVDGRIKPLMTQHLAEVTSLAFRRDGQVLASGSYDRTVKLHTMPKGPAITLSQGQKVHYLVFSPDGQTFASGSPKAMVRIWDAQTRDKRRTFHTGTPLHALCYSPDGCTLATVEGRSQGLVRLWDVATGTSRTGFEWEIGELHSVAFAPDGMCAAAGGIGKIVIWDVDY